MERLEDRSTPATITYVAATGQLTFQADVGDTDVVTVTATAANSVQIQVGGGDSIVLAGDAVANASFALTTTTTADDTLTINTSGAPLNVLEMFLGDQDDSVSFSLATATNGVGSVDIQGQVGNDSISFGNTTTGGQLQATAESITFGAGAALVATTGNIVLTASDTSLSGQNLILASGNSLQAISGSVSLLAGDDVKLEAGSSVTASGTITIQGDFDDQDPGTGVTIEIHGTVSATSLTATGGNDADNFSVKPSATTSISAVGGLPGTSPGDTLAFDLTGAIEPFIQVTFVAGDSRDGLVTFANREDVTFVSIETLPDIDVEVTASDNPDPALAAGALTLTVVIKNNGALGVSGITVTDNFPAEFTSPTWNAVFSGAGSTGTTNGSGNISESITLAAGGEATYTISGTIDANFIGTLSNTATASVPTGITDPDTGNNSATSDTTVNVGSDLAVSVVDAPDPVLLGSSLTYTITVTNNGPAAATAVVGSNTLPSSVTFQSANMSKGSILRSGNIITWNIGDLNDDESATLTVVVMTTQAGSISNSFAITSTHDDPHSNNNSAVTPTTVLFPGMVAVGAGPGNTPTVQVYDGATNTLKYAFDAYTSAFRGGVHVAMGDMNGDGVPDIVTGAGRGGGPHVRIFNGLDGSPLTSHPLNSFFAYSPSFSGGVFVAVGDVDGDGRNDIITGAGSGGGPHVIVRSGLNGAVIRSFLAYASGFLGGVRVAAGDVNRDGRADIITGAGPGGGPHVIAYSGIDNTILHGFFAYGSSFTGGVFVAAGDINGDGRADIITGAGSGGGPHVRAFSGANLSQLLSFMAFEPAFSGGVSVAAADVNNNGQNDVIVGEGPRGSRRIRVFNGANAAQVSTFNAFNANFLGGVFVGGS